MQQPLLKHLKEMGKKYVNCCGWFIGLEFNQNWMIHTQGCRASHSAFSYTCKHLHKNTSTYMCTWISTYVYMNIKKSHIGKPGKAFSVFQNILEVVQYTVMLIKNVYSLLHVSWKEGWSRSSPLPAGHTEIAYKGKRICRENSKRISHSDFYLIFSRWVILNIWVLLFKLRLLQGQRAFMVFQQIKVHNMLWDYRLFSVTRGYSAFPYFMLAP